MMKAAFHTLGCKLNFSETSTIASEFKNKDFEIVDFSESADVYVINTCTVTENADRECRKIIRRAKRINPDSYVIVTGCFAQIQSEQLSEMPEVDAVLGNEEKFKIFDLLGDNFWETGQSCVSVKPTDKIDDFHFASSSDADARTRAFFKIQDGCDYTCTYCTIPMARGKSRSQPVDDVLVQFKQILDDGYKEIILTGVNVGDYGHRIGTNLYELLQEMISVKGDFRIRISSIEPNLLSDEIIKLSKESEKLVNHFHIPLQSGSDKLLKAMRRRYNREFFNEKILSVHEQIPDVGIGIDVISGFPGESEDDFIETYQLLDSLPVSYLHAFTYSERENTDALNIAEVVPPAVRKARTNRLRELSEKKKREFYSAMKDTEQNVLFENANHEGYMYGFSSNYIKVKTEFNVDLVNKFTQIRIADCSDNFCSGKIIY
jgi:threonylcarbamoyladenosine tRNA methylthiotransferase MtaB